VTKKWVKKSFSYRTNLDLPAQQVWNLYKDRADTENRIKELKYDFGTDNFCLKHFFGTEAAFRFIMVAYNLLSLFRQIILREKRQSTLKPLRFKCFALGAWITECSHQRILKLPWLKKEDLGWTVYSILHTQLLHLSSWSRILN
jgi:hypothetical protein